MKLHYKFTLALLLITGLFSPKLFAQLDCEDATLMVNGQEYTGTLADFTSADFYQFAVSANSTPGSTISISISSDNADPLLSISTYLDGHCSGNEVVEYQGNISVGFSPTGLIPEFNSPLTLTVQPGSLYVIEIFNEKGSPENYSLQIDYDAAAITVVGPPEPPVPDEFSDANLWYKADAGVTTGATFEWENQANPATPVTGDATASQSNTNNQPTYNNTTGSAQINFNPSISFDGTDDVINTGTLTNYLGDVDGTNDKIASQFVVYKKLETVSGGEPIYNIDNLNYLDQQAIFLGAKTNGRMLQESRRADLATAASLNEIILVDMVATSSSTPSNQDFSLNKNGVLNQNPTIGGGYTTVNTAQDGALRFGRYQDDFGNFVIAELLVYPKQVSSSLRKEIQSYLAIKYGISLGDNQGLALYFNSSGLAVYVSNVYNNDVFGIAKDDGAGLNQTQSNSMNTGSGDGTGQSGKGNIVLSNASSLEDGDYLIIGHDNADLEMQLTNLPAGLPAGFSRLQRKWMADETGDVGDVKLTFDISGINGFNSTNPLDYRILIDEDGDGDFQTGTVSQIDPDRITGTVLEFDAISFDNEGGGKDIFTFATIGPIAWTGNVDTDWAIAGNWDVGTVPVATSNVTIPDGLTNYPVIGGPTNAVCTKLNISPGATLSVDGNLTVSDSIIVSSDVSASGSLIANGTVTGDITFQSFLAETGKWHVVAAPVASQNIWSFAGLAGNSIAENAGKRAITEYVESTNDWDTNYPTADTEGSFSPGSGYSVLRSAPGVVSYTGTINTSDVSKSLSRSLYGWNALGNPYTSAINATTAADATNTLLNATNISNLDPSFAALYLWDSSADDYVTISNTGATFPETTNLSQNYIQAGQGFFVRAKDNSGLTFSITKAMQSHQTAIPLKSGENAWPTIQLAIEGNGKQSSTLLTFNDEMTTGLDVSYDAGMFKADKEFALYSRLLEDNNVDFAIQALPQNYDNMEIPIGIDVPSGTEVTFRAQATNLPADAAVWLEDRAAKTFTQLDVNGSQYKVFVTEQIKGTGNFFIHTLATTTNVNDFENNLMVFTRDRKIYVSGNINTRDLISIIGIDGKLHYKKTAGTKGFLQIDASKMPAGIYIVGVESEAGQVTRKVVINE